MSTDHYALNARKRSRRLAMQAVYQLQMSGTEAVDIEKQFKQQEEFHSADAAYFHELLFAIEKSSDVLGALLSKYIDRPMAEIDPVERAILLIGAYELSHRPEIPYRAIVSEAVNLAKKFGATDGYKYINGILDKAAKATRQHEVERG